MDEALLLPRPVIEEADGDQLDPERLSDFIIHVRIDYSQMASGDLVQLEWGGVDAAGKTGQPYLPPATLVTAGEASQGVIRLWVPKSQVDRYLGGSVSVRYLVNNQRVSATARYSVRPSEALFTAEFYHPVLTYHLVLFKFKPGLTSGQKAEVFNRFLALQNSRRPGSFKPYILFIHAGTANTSLEGASMGFEQAYTVAFKSEGDRNYYVGKPIVTDPNFFDPQHDAFKAFVGPLLADQCGALVFDYKVVDN